MNHSRLVEILIDYRQINEEDYVSLGEIMGQYPYFQPGHALIAKYRHDRFNEKNSEAITVAALYTTNRSSLKKLISGQLKSTPTSIHHAKEQVTHQDTITETEHAIPESEPIEENEPIVHGYDSKLVEEIWSGLAELHENKKKYEAATRNYELKMSNTPKQPLNPVTESSKYAHEEDIKQLPPKVKPKSNNLDQKEYEVDNHQNDDDTEAILKYLESIKKEENNQSNTTRVQEQMKMIDRFIEHVPQILSTEGMRNDEKNKELPDLSLHSTTENEDIVSENLAIILTKQGKLQKATNTYKKLIWKFPQKKSYFATRIKELEQKL